MAKMNIADQLGLRLTEQQAAPKPVVFIACVLSPLQLQPAKLLEEIDGLLAVQDVRKDDGRTVFVTYWASREHFTRGRDAALAQLQATLIVMEGPAGQLHTQSKQWWKKVKLSTVLLSTAALLGAMEVVSNRYERLFASPELGVRSEKQVFSLIEADDFTTTVTVENLLPVAEHRNLVVSAVLVDAKGVQLPMTVLDPQMSSLTATKARVFDISGKVPLPGEYHLKIGVHGKAGWLRAAKAFTVDSRVKVWPQKPQGYVKLKKSRSTNADYVVFVEVGHAAPFGILCEFTLTGGGKMDFDRNEWRSIEATTLGNFLVAGSGDNATSRLRWSWASTAAQKSLRAELTLAGEAGTDWSSVANKAKVECTPMKEKTDVIT